MSRRNNLKQVRLQIAKLSLSGDEFMIRQLLQPVSEKLISLGEGVTAQQVSDFKYQLNQVRDKIAVVGGSKDPRVLNLSGTAEELKILDGCEWFVRQVAAVFNISTAKLKLAVDTSRANTRLNRRRTESEPEAVATGKQNTLEAI